MPGEGGLGENHRGSTGGEPPGEDRDRPGGWYFGVGSDGTGRTVDESHPRSGRTPPEVRGQRSGCHRIPWTMNVGPLKGYLSGVIPATYFYSLSHAVWATWSSFFATLYRLFVPQVQQWETPNSAHQGIPTAGPAPGPRRSVCGPGGGGGGRRRSTWWRRCRRRVTRCLRGGGRCRGSAAEGRRRMGLPGGGGQRPLHQVQGVEYVDMITALYYPPRVCSDQFYLLCTPAPPSPRLLYQANIVPEGTTPPIGSARKSWWEDAQSQQPQIGGRGGLSKGPGAIAEATEDAEAGDRAGDGGTASSGEMQLGAFRVARPELPSAAGAGSIRGNDMYVSQNIPSSSSTLPLVTDGARSVRDEVSTVLHSALEELLGSHQSSQGDTRPPPAGPTGPDVDSCSDKDDVGHPSGDRKGPSDPPGLGVDSTDAAVSPLCRQTAPPTPSSPASPSSPSSTSSPSSYTSVLAAVDAPEDASEGRDLTVDAPRAPPVSRVTVQFTPWKPHSPLLPPDAIITPNLDQSDQANAAKTTKVEEETGNATSDQEAASAVVASADGRGVPEREGRRFWAVISWMRPSPAVLERFEFVFSDIVGEVRGLWTSNIHIP